MAQAARSDRLVSADQGFGPLLQRDYWAVISSCRAKPSEVISRITRGFADFSPERLCLFEPEEACSGRELKAGDRLMIHIPMAGRCRVKVLHRDAQSLTLGTIEGHPEAGRITFGAYRNDRGDVVFHIRSRARSGSPAFYLGFVAMGEAMQTSTWAEFVNRVASTFGDGAAGAVHADTIEIEDERVDAASAHGPTFVARGD
jgi:hypothetical protein